MVTRDIIQRLLGIINDTRSRLNTLEAKEVALLTATQTLTNKTLTTPTIGDFTNAQHAHTNAASGGTISHNSLTDLTTGDPHTQYLLESVYDANTILKADADNTPIALTVDASTIVGRASTGSIAALTAAQVATIVQGSIDHGSIAGLADDDHTGYARLAGRSGGQTLIGGTAANDDLTLEGTSNATRTTSYVVLQPNGGNVGIGTTSPGTKLDIAGSYGSDTSVLNFRNLTDGTQVFQNVIWQARDSGSILRTYGSVGVKASSAQNDETRGGEMAFATMDSSGTNSVRMTITNAGDVGIGTTSPTTLLHLQSSIPTLTIKGTGSGEFGLTILDNSSSVGGLTYSSVTGEQRLNGAQLYVYQTVYAGGAERMRITTDGNVGIGTTSPDTRLDIDAGAIEFAEITAPIGGAVNTARLFCQDNGIGKTQLCVRFNTGAVQVIATQP